MDSVHNKPEIEMESRTLRFTPSDAFVIDEATFQHLKNQFNHSAADSGYSADFAVRDLPRVSESTLSEVKSQYEQAYFYLIRFYRLIIQASVADRIGFLVFSQDNVLIHKIIPARMKPYLDPIGIEEGQIWSGEYLGCNAATIGLAISKGCRTVAKENYNLDLQHLALFYSPLNTNEDREGKFMNLGGLVLIAPSDLASENLHALAYSAALYVMSTIYFYQTTTAFYDSTQEGVLEIDYNLMPNTPFITYCNEHIAGFAGIPKEDLSFVALKDVVEPLPSNKEFWSIVNEARELSKYPVTVSLRGHEPREYILSSRRFFQPRIGPNGLFLFMNTPQQIASNISSQTANSAILGFDNIIGSSYQIENCKRKAKQIAQISSNVMLLGESGVGKDIFAQAIHNASPRKDKPFIAVNCGALPRDLIASELFGYDAGAFTGAKRQGNIGKFELANGGTIFLDEIGELPLDLQATLLRVVEEKRFMRLGSNKFTSVDVRIIAATNANLPEMVRNKTFRSDLFYRLGAIQLFIPPLRERGNDCVELAEYFIKRTSRSINRQEPLELSYQAKQLLLTLPWNGNVRELQNCMDCVTLLYSGIIVTPEQILENLQFSEGLNPQAHAAPAAAARPVYVPQTPPSGIRHVALTEDQIREAIAVCGNNKCAAARYLGVSTRTLYRKMEKLGMEL